MRPTVEAMENDRLNDQLELLSRIESLSDRVHSAYKANDNTLALDFLLEYDRLLRHSVIQWGTHNKDFEMLLAETVLYAATRLKAQRTTTKPLTWLTNALARLREAIDRASPGLSIPAPVLHPKIVAASMPQFRDGHFADAIFNAFRAVEQEVRNKSGSAEYGRNLMSSVFSEQRPLLRIKASLPETWRDEQEGYKFLFMGASVGIRNPKGHFNLEQTDRTRTLQLLTLASLLLDTLDHAEKVAPPNHHPATGQPS